MGFEISTDFGFAAATASVVALGREVRRRRLLEAGGITRLDDPRLQPPEDREFSDGLQQPPLASLHALSEQIDGLVGNIRCASGCCLQHVGVVGLQS